MSDLRYAAVRRKLEHFYEITGSGQKAADLAGVATSTAYDYLRSRGLTKSTEEAVAIATDARARRCIERGLRIFRAIRPDRTLRETAEAVGVNPGSAYYVLARACEHLGVDYEATRARCRLGHSPQDDE